jgi:hypothetical protein
MRRREFITLLGGWAAAWPPAAGAQRSLPLIGFLGIESPYLWASRLSAFRQGLGEVGFIEGRNVAVEYRWAEGQYDRLPALASELVHRQVTLSPRDFRHGTRDESSRKGTGHLACSKDRAINGACCLGRAHARRFKLGIERDFHAVRVYRTQPLAHATSVCRQNPQWCKASRHACRANHKGQLCH